MTDEPASLYDAMECGHPRRYSRVSLAGRPYCTVCELSAYREAAAMHTETVRDLLHTIASLRAACRSWKLAAKQYRAQYRFTLDMNNRRQNVLNMTIAEAMKLYQAGGDDE